jgi:uncharacterized protein YcbK (DUF882 family)
VDAGVNTQADQTHHALTPVDAAPAAARGLTMFELARLEEARRAAADVQAAVRASAGDAVAADRATAWRRRARDWARMATVAAVSVGAVFAYQRARGAGITAAAVPVAPRPIAPAEAPPAASSAAGAADASGVPVRLPVRVAFGQSAGVYLQVAAPGQIVAYPVALAAPGARARYQWVRAGDGAPATGWQPLTGGAVVAPARPGVYHLALASVPAADSVGAPDAPQRVLDEVSLAVLTPFAEKIGGTLNGYLIGRYPFEQFGGERPAGFVEVTPQTARLPISRHLRLEDFVTHDGQRLWPKYVAVRPELLDKIELVAAEVAKIRGLDDPGRVAVRVHSGFRTPLHNGNVEGSAFNSRHQYGDALDVAFDTDGDGRFTSFDAQVAAAMAEMVEKRRHDLVGGLGRYTSTASPYVHIDVRGKKARWWKR